MSGASEYPDDVTVYLVVNDFGSLGRAFVETDIGDADRETVIHNFLTRLGDGLPSLQTKGPKPLVSCCTSSLGLWVQSNSHVTVDVPPAERAQHRLHCS
jgi:hypothetical protein